MHRCRDCHWASQIDTACELCCLGGNPCQINSDSRACRDFEPRDQPITDRRRFPPDRLNRF